jgi:hypothetical protein
MGKRYFVAVYTDSGCLISCDHKHPNVSTATACISQAGGYVVAARRSRFLALTESEEAQFQVAMYGRAEPERRANAPDLGLLVNET